MHGLEVISIRVSGKEAFENVLKLCSQISTTVETDELINVSMYRSTTYETDLSVHIHWSLKSFKQKKSLLGIQLAQGLINYGIVSHTLWIEQAEIMRVID